MTGQGRTNIRNPTSGVLNKTCFANNSSSCQSTGVTMKHEGTMSQKTDLSAN